MHPNRTATGHAAPGNTGSALRERLFVVGVTVVVALLIVVVAAFKPVKSWWELRDFRSKDLSEIGAPPSVCGEVITKKATGSQQHVDPGTEVDYPDAPPAFGKHEAVPEAMDRKFYTSDDRPAIAKLVHNLEHGYTILWYDEAAARDHEQLKQLRAIADKLQGTINARLKFKAVPWIPDDGASFPAGKHIVFTHWSKGGKDASSNDDQVGVWQYCSKVSGAALNAFMLEYPYQDSPEPSAQ